MSNTNILAGNVVLRNLHDYCKKDLLTIRKELEDYVELCDNYMEQIEEDE